MLRDPEFLERNRKIFEEELDDFLPENILDFHVHIFNEGIHAPDDPYMCGGHPISKYDYEDLRSDWQQALPGRKLHAVCFGEPNPERDNASNNRYVADNADHETTYPMRLFDPVKDTPDQLRSEIEESKYIGLKPYLTFVRKEDPNTVEIREMLPDWCMEIADDLGLIIVLHIPRPGRFADPINQRQLVELAKSYPNAKLNIAHIGRAYFLKNILGSLDDLIDLPNVYLELAMVQNPDVLEYVFRTFPKGRLLYGSDIPIAIAPGKAVEINHQYTYVTPVQWKLSITDDKKKLIFTSFLYEELRAIKTAVERLSLGRDFVEDLFFRNGMRLLGKM